MSIGHPMEREDIMKLDYTMEGNHICLTNGTKEKHHFVTLKVVTDERICDGYYYASAMKRMKRILLHPEILDEPPATVVEDID